MVNLNHTGRIIVLLLIIFIPHISSSSEREHLLQVDKFNLRSPVKSWISLRDKDMVRQAYDYSCGASSLSTILNIYFNEKIDEKDILDDILKNKCGDLAEKEKLEDKDFRLSFYDIEEFAKQRGYKAIGLALPVEGLKQLKVPAIVYVKIRRKEHFSVYKGMDSQFVYLADPSFGNIKVRIGKFRQMFETRGDDKCPGRILVFIPMDESKKAGVNKGFMEIPEKAGIVYKVIGMNCGAY